MSIEIFKMYYQTILITLLSKKACVVSTAASYYSAKK